MIFDNKQATLEVSFYKEIAKLGEKDKVHLVQHVETGKVFVKKVLSYFDTKTYEFLLENEISGIPKCHQIFKIDNELIVIEEYINGNTIEELISKDGKRFTYLEVAEVISRICEILSRLHNTNPPIVHRDIKASNIIISNENNIYLTDFDISKKTNSSKNRDTKLMGTFGYAAPEQYGFMECSSKTDIYGLGILMKYMLTGNIEDVQDYEGIFKSIIKKATMIDPVNRYDDVLSMKQEIMNEIEEYTCRLNHNERMGTSEKRKLSKVDIIAISYGAIMLIFSLFQINWNQIDINESILSIAAFIVIISPSIYYFLLRMNWSILERFNRNIFYKILGFTFFAIVLTVTVSIIAGILTELLELMFIK